VSRRIQTGVALPFAQNKTADPLPESSGVTLTEPASELAGGAIRATKPIILPL
jgi:hypothetical protein